jgi:hypothetical protein
MLITAITCTADRPEAFALCEKYVSRQTRKPDQWLVLDDGDKPIVPTMGQQYIYCPEFRGKKSMVSKVRMALVGGLVKGDALVFIEDDDFYRENWIAWCAEKLANLDLVGEGWAVYYNVRDRTWFSHTNATHASLCSTAIGRRFFPLILEVCNGIMRSPDNDAFIDEPLWKLAPNRKMVLSPNGIYGRRMVIGIKAMPGKVGYGPAHVRRDSAAKDDPKLEKLCELIGDDAGNYAGFFQTPRTPIAIPTPPIPSAQVVNIAKSETGRAHGPNWLKWLAPFQGKKGVVGMEIGTFQGESAEWFCDNIVTGDGAQFFCCDPFTGSPEHVLHRIDVSHIEEAARARLARFPQCTIIKDYSGNVLPTFPASLSFIYVDGLHTAKGALSDMVFAFRLLKIGGVMICDDYAWDSMPLPIDRPKMAIDSFLAIYAREIQVIGKAWQVAFIKISE